MVQAAGRDPVDAFLVLVSLLVGDADQLSHLLLGQTKKNAPVTHACAHMPVDVLRPRSACGPLAATREGFLRRRLQRTLANAD
jgi:hypothetical protein